MSVFSDINNTTDKATDIGERYIKTSRQYFKLKVFQQLTLSISLLAKVLAIGSFVFVGSVFLSIALAIKLSNEFESTVLGFMAVGGIYIIIAIVIYSLRAKLTRMIIRSFSIKYFD